MFPRIFLDKDNKVVEATAPDAGKCVRFDNRFRFLTLFDWIRS